MHPMTFGKAAAILGSLTPPIYIERSGAAYRVWCPTAPGEETASDLEAALDAGHLLSKRLQDAEREHFKALAALSPAQKEESLLSLAAECGVPSADDPMVCHTCGSDRVELRVTLNPNRLTVATATQSARDTFCPECGRWDVGMCRRSARGQMRNGRSVPAEVAFPCKVAVRAEDGGVWHMQPQEYLSWCDAAKAYHGIRGQWRIVDEGGPF